MHEFLSTENVAQDCTVVNQARRLGGGGGFPGFPGTHPRSHGLVPVSRNRLSPNKFIPRIIYSGIDYPPRINYSGIVYHPLE